MFQEILGEMPKKLNLFGKYFKKFCDRKREEITTSHLGPDNSKQSSYNKQLLTFFKPERTANSWHVLCPRSRKERDPGRYHFLVESHQGDFDLIL
mmetsp:Transcript_28478/g.37947  ORF Transcript_28478/g.37947 Transcript_28478/m.37947 type:complete len:95 (-) Transcript_28478:84-368(-)